MKGLKTRSINSKITAMVVTLTLILSMAFVSISSLLSYRAIETIISKDSLKTTEDYAQLLGNWFLERTRESRVYAENPLVKTMDWDKIKPYLKKEMSQKPEEYCFLGVADPQGNYRINSSEQAINISDRTYFKNAMDGYYTISEPLESRFNNKKIVIFAAPIKQGESIIGVLAIGIDAAKLYNFMGNRRESSDESYIFLIDEKGTIVNHPKNTTMILENINNKSINVPEGVSKNASKIMHSYSGKLTFKEEKNEKIAFYSEIPNTGGWKVIFVRPYSNLNSPIFDLLTSLVILGIMITMAGILVSRFIARTISEPIITLSEVFDKAAGGNLTVTADETMYGEIGDAARSFNTMMKTVSNMTYYDPLTGLLNRDSFIDRLRVEIGHAKDSNENLAIFYIAIDKFKKINDAHGHEGGDLLLKKIAERLRDLFSNIVIGRMSGDEFLIVMRGYHTQGHCSKIASSILEVFRKAWNVQNKEFYITASIGIAVFPEDGENEAEIIKNAGIAKSKVKESGGDNFNFYNREMNVKLQEQLTLDVMLHNALENNEFIVYYQPFISLKTGRIEAVEALIRWKNKELGMVSPGKFIPRAEDNGLIVPIGEWVLREACRQNKAWQDKGLRKICMSVNVSAYQFEQKDFAEMVKRILDETSLDPSYLELEITEGVAMNNIEDKIITLLKLKELGVKISIDDFGTGFSSLNYLRRFPIDNLKIDQSFVRDIANNESAKSIISTIVSMGNNLNLGLVAEGVETEDQLSFIKEQNCDKIQGFIFSKPIDSESFTEMLTLDKKFI